MIFLIMLCAARGESVGSAAPPCPGGAIPLAHAAEETAASSDRSPTASLGREDAFAAAEAIVRRSHRDLTIGTVASTGSMRPYFDENALLLLEKVPYTELKVGDVVTFYHPVLHVLVVHRLLEKRGNLFWSKGDHNRHMDSVYVTPENFQRRLAGVIYFSPSAKPEPTDATAAYAAP